MEKSELLSYMRSHKLAVIGTAGSNGPQGALVGIAVTDDFEIVFDTVSDSRKHRNLLRNGRIAVTFSGPAEQTAQYEGEAHSVSIADQTDARYREAYYAVWPDGRDRLSWPKIAYWRITPRWVRFSDFDRGPLIEEFVFE